MALLLARPSARRGIKRRPFLAEINVTPFVDVMLVLLIVFMVTAPLLTVGIPVDLPKTEARALPDPATEPLVITIQGDGAVFLQETAVPIADLVPKLEAIAAAGYDKRIYVRADRQALWDVVSQVMARLQAAGFANIGLVNEPISTPATGAAAPAR